MVFTCAGAAYFFLPPYSSGTPPPDPHIRDPDGLRTPPIKYTKFGPDAGPAAQIICLICRRPGQILRKIIFPAARWALRIFQGSAPGIPPGLEEDTSA
jgi:hypothetical protein